MIRVFGASFQRSLAWRVLGLGLLATCGMAWGSVGSWQARVAGVIQSLEGLVERCASGLECPAGPGRAWVEIRWSGASRVIRRLESKQAPGLDAAIARLGSAELPAPTRPGASRIWVLGRSQGWEQPRVLLERASGPDRSVALLTGLGSEFAGTSATAQKRFWIFTSQGEVIHQSEGRYLGSSFAGNPYLGRPGEQLSFDQLKVRAHWSSDPRLGGWLLEEDLLPEAPRAGGWEGLGLAFKAVLVLGLLGVLWTSSSMLRLAVRFFRIRRIRRLRRLGRHRPLMTSNEPQPETQSIEVVVPRVLEGVRDAPKVSEAAVLDSILAARSLPDLVRRLIAIIAEQGDSPVIFLEYHRETGLAVFREQAGLQDRSVPLSLRVPLVDTPGGTGEQPALQKLMLARMGVSHFEVLELRSPNREGLRSRLLGVFVILRPGVTSFERHEFFEALMERAGRYHDAVLRPHPPRLAGQDATI